MKIVHIPKQKIKYFKAMSTLETKVGRCSREWFCTLFSYFPLLVLIRSLFISFKKNFIIMFLKYFCLSYFVWLWLDCLHFFQSRPNIGFLVSFVTRKHNTSWKRLKRFRYLASSCFNCLFASVTVRVCWPWCGSRAAVGARTRTKRCEESVSG